MSAKVVLQTYDLAVGYAPPRRPVHCVAEHINLELRAGELVCLIGPNGAGKSTLMRTLAAMQTPLSGRVTLMGDDIHQMKADELAQRLSLVLTDRVNPGLLSGYELVALGRHPYTDWAGRLSPRDEAVVQWAVEAVGGAHLAERAVAELSDGERQKMMIARALTQEPSVLILDEPTAFLDLPRRVEIMALLRELAHVNQQAVLLSTHDLDLALRSADRIWLLPTEGEILVGAPEDLVLSGAFQETFRGEGVEFDAETGSFRVVARSARLICLRGDGLAAIWARRALERAGFQVAAEVDSALALVEVVEDGWRLTHNGSASQFDTLYKLVATIQAL